jgi:hypothetical protein
MCAFADISCLILWLATFFSLVLLGLIRDADEKEESVMTY